ncbi:MAG: hypothetical protein U0105_08095 [Candidatus Obscuribacterales bacterium]
MSQHHTRAHTHVEKAAQGDTQAVYTPPEVPLSSSDAPAQPAPMDQVRQQTYGAGAQAGTFSRSGDVYSPVRPPGVGEAGPGVDCPDDQVDGIDYRKVQTRHNLDGSVSHFYAGELEDGWIFDTGFSATETLKNGKVVSSEVNYNPPKTFQVLDGNGVMTLANVESVRTELAADGNYHSVIECADHTKYEIVTDSAGKTRDVSLVCCQ